jgi:hypothetical protein
LPLVLGGDPRDFEKLFHCIAEIALGAAER